LSPTWTAEELGKRTSIERFIGHVFSFFRLQRRRSVAGPLSPLVSPLPMAATVLVALALSRLVVPI
jgi:hypothetical protein